MLTARMLRRVTSAGVFVALFSTAAAAQPSAPAQYLSVSAGPAVQWFSPDGYVWDDVTFREPVVVSHSSHTYGGFAFSGGGVLRERWWLLFDINGHVPGATPLGNVLVGLSLMRPVSPRLRLQAGAGLGGLVVAKSVEKPEDERGDAEVPWQFGGGVYGVATYDLVRFGDWALNVQARGTIAAYELIGSKAFEVHIGISH